MTAEPACPYYPAQPEQPFLLASDVDGTMLGDETGEAWLRALIASYPGAIYLALITGWHLASVQGAIRAGRLPQPQVICHTVGTEIFDCRDPENLLGKRYATLAPVDWSPAVIYARGEGEGVRRQSFPDGLPRFQVGFDWDGRPETLMALRTRLSWLENCHINPSNGCYIDVLPEAMGKGGAARFLQAEFNLPPERVVVTGDAGNDLEMFRTSFQGILPANALPELRNYATRPWHYHSSLPAGRGVLDGLRHFGFLTAAAIQV